MSISEKSLYNEQKYKFCKEIKDGCRGSREEIVREMLLKSMSKRKPHEIDMLRTRLKEKSLAIDKASGFQKLKRKKEKKKKQIVLSRCKNISKLNLHKPPAECRYEQFVILNELWMGYAKSLFGNTHKIIPDEKILRMDFHGANVTIVNSKCPSNIGIKGILIKETKFTIIVVTPKNETKTFIKDQIVFSFNIDDNVIKINGTAIIGKPGWRAAKKWKVTAENSRSLFPHILT